MCAASLECPCRLLCQHLCHLLGLEGHMVASTWKTDHLDLLKAVSAILLHMPWTGLQQCQPHSLCCLLEPALPPYS